MNDPRVVPTEAQRAGTVNLIDRSRQYTRADSPELLRSLNEAWSKIRRLEQQGAQKDLAITTLQARVRSYRFGLVLLTSIVTTLAWRGVEVLGPMLLRYFGMGN